MPTITVAMATIVALLWVALVDGWLPMPGSGMAMPMSTPGAPEMMGTSNGPWGVLCYLLMWGTMMAAMMVPSMVPPVRRYANALRGGRLTAALHGAALLVTYTAVWALTGVVPLAVDLAVSISGLAAEHGRLLIGGSLLVAGIYQLSSVKHRFLNRCRSCSMDRHRPDLRRAIRMGLRHGINCIGCTWALFAFMVAVGSMNTVWMVALTLVVSLERLVEWGDEIAWSVGLVAVVAGAAVLSFGVPLI